MIDKISYREKLEIFKSKVLDALKNTDISQIEIQTVRKKSNIDLIKVYLRDNLNRFDTIFENKKIDLKISKHVTNKIIHDTIDLNEFEYVYQILKLFKQVGVPSRDLSIMKKLNSSIKIIDYSEKKLPKFISALNNKKIDIYRLKKRGVNEKSIYTKIFYTPMGNKK